MASKEYNHILYHNRYSVCSLMVRLSYTYRGAAKDATNEIVIKEQSTDLFKGEHLTEQFLCEVNSYGEVPVLVPVNGKPIPDSVAITLHLARCYPVLSPEGHSAEIERLLKQLHGINFFSLTFAGKPQSPMGLVQLLKKRLDEDISERYRAAIQVKIRRLETQKIAAVVDDEVETNKMRVAALMDELQAILKDSHTGWFFGLSQPSALDVHVLVFVARMFDVKRHELIPEPMQIWANKFMQKDEWKDLMQGGGTMPPTPPAPVGKPEVTSSRA